MENLWEIIVYYCNYFDSLMGVEDRKVLISMNRVYVYNVYYWMCLNINFGEVNKE